MGNKEIVETTANRSTFNRAYKQHLEKTGKIHCSRCHYHRGENEGRKYYGGFYRTNGHLKMTYPNWKLVSKNPRQWMQKPIKTVESIHNSGTRWERIYFNIRF
jgi:hypothetical protein